MKYILSLFILIFSISSKASNKDLETLREWVPAAVVDESAVRKYSLDSCFQSQPITNEIFSRIHGKSYKQNCTIPRSQLRYLKILHRNIEGENQLGELICNEKIAGTLTSIFKELYKANYIIERMVLIDEYGADDEKSMTANNTSCFNFRTVSGSSKLSKHSQGLAIDINPLYNPCLRIRNGKIEPAAGKSYARNRSQRPNLKIRLIDKNDLCYKLFVRHGFIWGGAWNSVKDYQHFEK